MIKRILSVLAVFCLAPAAAETNQFQEGMHFKRIDSPSSVEAGRVEVVEVFSYACPACAQFQPYISRWEEELPEYVDFRRLPVVFQPSWEPFAQAYHAASVLGIVEDGHQALFDALHTERRRMRTMEDLARFWSDYGVSADDFLSTAGSFIVDTRTRQARNDAGRWRVGGTPTLVVNGKWRIGAGRDFPGNQTYDDIIKALDYLVSLEAPADYGAEDEAGEPTEDEAAADQASGS